MVEQSSSPRPRPFTVADAIHAADKELGYSDGTFIAGKWHLGPFFNGSTPLDHGFDHMFMTQEVAPTSTTNCMCEESWEESCNFGHNGPWACANVSAAVLNMLLTFLLPVLPETTPASA